ncbi:tandem C2 domains nuclear protein-like isoform X2 [Myxocyprinus asiaticus]|uniref:tandem C2 domains nuclear protein-like isoform X2 n=1 Tax=Myxocyprinus asiaticus TaxID=70543 RepID=UPI0022219E9B|nr:tandem C2 domains nuclear protein-like isoform X2 [Myxocyprinus asiaticus]
MECIKNCCRTFMSKEKEPEIQMKSIRPPGKLTVESYVKKSVGVSEDYLLSKLPPDDREVPFVLPTFKPSYIQPRGAQYSSYNIGQQTILGSSKTTYAVRKAELAGANQIVYDPDLTFNTSQIISFVSPGSVRRPSMKGHPNNSPGTSWEHNGKQRLSLSMFDLSNSQGPVQRYDSVSSVQSSTSSIQDSFGSSRSLESITLSGDERDRELGKVCVHLRYEEAVEQVWITLLKCADMSVYTEGVELQKIGVKGVITMTKPVRFKSTVKEASADTEFMETFVFTLNLEQIRRSALLLRLQAHTPRKRTLGECVLSLRTLGPQETQHWLEFRPHSKIRVCHAELQLALCFQPVSSRMQLQILSAQNLPSSSSPLTHSFFVKVDMLRDGQSLLKRKTKIMKSLGGHVQWGEVLLLPITNQDQNLQLSLKLFSRGSLQRKHLLGQVLLGFDCSSPEAVEQWRDSITHPEKVVTSWHRVSRP